MSLPRSGSFPVGQLERLTVRLAGLIRDYPRGPGIVKEFLQNADDAGAKGLRVILDCHDYGRDLPVDSPLRQVLGPALLLANDARFSDDDFNGIRHIGESGKRLTTSKTGRFGVGFNTAYNVTDYPSFLSREWMFCFDPHGDAIAERPEDHGRGFVLSEFRTIHPQWLQSFVAAGLDPASNNHNGTIFRLPLRTPDRARISEISQEPFDEKTFREIAKALIDEGPKMLLFTRNILDLTVHEIPPDGGPGQPVLSVSTVNREEIETSRARVYSSVHHSIDELAADWTSKPAPSSSHHHTMLVESDSGPKHSNWRVTVGFFPDAAGALLAQAKKLARFGEKAIPEAGIAVALDDASPPENSAPTIVKGHLYCGLPLSSFSGFPVHINGCFDLDEARIGITSGDAALGNARERAEWNELLLKGAVASAYVEALQSIPTEMVERDPAKFYALWPDIERISSPMLREAAIAVHKALAATQIFRCSITDGIARRRLDELFLLPKDEAPELKEALVADGLVIADPPLPSSILSGAAAAEVKVSRVTPAFLRNRWLRTERKDWKLEDAPFPALRRRDWLDSVTRFMIGGDPKLQLKGLPLALLANGKGSTFGYSPGNTIFVGSEIERAIFRTCSHWFIDPDYQNATGLTAQAKAQFEEMTASKAMRNLHVMLPKAGIGGRREWNPDNEKIPNANWLKLVLDYLSQNSEQISIDDLAEFPLIPDQFGRLHAPHCVSTPLLISKAAEGLAAALRRLGVPVVSGEGDLISAVDRLASAFPEDAVFEADGPDLIDGLKAYVDEWSQSPARNEAAVYGAILDCLAQPRCLEQIQDSWLTDLKLLPLIPTEEGTVSSGETNLFIPSGEQPPPVAGAIKLVKTGPRERWRPIFERLGIPVLDLPAVIRHLVASYGDQPPQHQLDILRYIRDNFSRALDQEAAKGDRTLSELLANSSLIVATDGLLRPAADLFDHRSRDAIALLGELALFPDMDVYRAGQDAWPKFFLSIGLKQNITAKDILHRIDSLTMNPPSRESRRNIQQVFVFVQKHWDSLSEQIVDETNDEDFAVAFKRRAWAPSVQDETSFPGLQKPEDRWYRLDELYPRSLGHRVCSQAPLFDGQDPAAPVQSALDMMSTPSLEVVTQHFDQLRELWRDNQILEIDALTTSLRQIYTYFGQQARKRGAPAVDALLKHQYADVDCIWDRARRRFVRPRDTFSERVPFFEPHKISVTGDSQLQAGLDALGRKAKPDLYDYIDFLQILKAFKQDAPCETQEQMQALHALKFISDGFDPSSHTDLPVLTTTNRLLGIGDVFYDDAIHLKGRIDITGIDVIDPDVPLRIRSAAARLTDAIVEVLARRPELSSNRELEKASQRLSDILHSEEFAYGLKRLVSQNHMWRVDEFSSRFDHFSVYPAISINTDFYFQSQSGTPNRIGGGAVPLFVDNENSEIWITIISPRRTAIELARSIDQLLGDFQGVNLAALEDMLRVGSTAEIADVLKDRRVPELGETEKREIVWDPEHEPSHPLEGDEEIFEGEAEGGGSQRPEQHQPSESSETSELPSPEGIVRGLVDGLNRTASSRDQNGRDRSPGRISGSNSQVELPSLEKVSLQIAQNSEEAISAAASSSRSGGASSSNWSPRSGRDVERDKMIGNRGEELVYRHEIERLRNLGVTNPEGQVVWTSQKDPGADHDIKSISEDGRPLWIEVKATRGTDGRFEWTQNEFRKALTDGEHYELWRIYEADTEHPTAKRFRNPIALLECSALTLELSTLRAAVEPRG
jgi:sacsin